MTSYDTIIIFGKIWFDLVLTSENGQLISSFKLHKWGQISPGPISIAYSGQSHSNSFWDTEAKRLELFPDNSYDAETDLSNYYSNLDVDWLRNSRRENIKLGEERRSRMTN